MRQRRPPAAALWLLERLGFTRGNAPLVGDLLEEFGCGRSALWFWRQTLIIIALAAGRRVARLQFYWMATAAGFVAQLPVSYLLFRWRIPPAAQDSGWKVAALVPLILSLAFLPALGRRVFGKTAKDLKSILLQPGTGVLEQRAALAGATAFESFACLLLLYCISCVWSPSVFSSYAEVAGCELLWLGIGEATSEVMIMTVESLREVRKAEKREWETRAWPQLNDLAVTLIASDGSTILLEPGTCVETIFGSANVELITLLFHEGTSGEQIRRAIWLARAAEYAWPKRFRSTRFQPVPVSKFSRLLGPGTEDERLGRYLDRT